MSSQNANLATPALPAKTRLLPWRHRTLGLVDQGLVSASSFVAALLLARSMAPAELGRFSLAYAAALLAFTLQAATLTQPLLVLAPGRQGRSRSAYLTGTAWQQILLVAILVFGLVMAALIMPRWWPESTPVVWALIPLVITYQAHEFGRRILLAQQRLQAVLIADATMAITRLGLVLALIHSERLASPAVLAAFAISFAAGCLPCGWFCAKYFRATAAERATAWRDNWRLGKWLLGVNLLAWIGGHIHMFVVAERLGTADVGAIRAVQILLGPLTVVLQAVENVVPPYISSLRQQGDQQTFRDQLQQIGIHLLVVGGICCVMAAGFAEPLLDLLFRDQYRGYVVVVVVIAATLAVGLVSRLPAIGLRACEQTRPVFLTYAISTTWSVVAIYPAVACAGLVGALCVPLVAAAINSGLVGLALRRCLRQLPQGTQE